MHAILGAGGAIGNALSRELHKRGIPIRQVSRAPAAVHPHDQVVAATGLSPTPYAEGIRAALDSLAPPARRSRRLKNGVGVLLLSAGLALAGCAESGSDPGEEASTGEWSLQEEVRIGGHDEGPELFGQIADLAVDADGRILVLDQQASELRVFGPEGEHEATLGGPGEGPGEFTRPNGVTIHPDDGSIWVMSAGRYTVFEADGTFRTTHPRPFGYFAVPWPGGFDGEGRLGDVASGTEFVRFDADMRSADTLEIPRVEVDQVRVTRGDGAGVMTMTAPFASRLHWQVDTHGHLWTAESSAMRFVAERGPGDTVAVREREHRPVPVSRREADEAVARVEGQAAGFGEDIRVEGDLRAADTKPAFQGFRVDDEGRIWVEPSRAEDEDPALELWTADGEWAGRIAAPPGLQLLYPAPLARGDHLWAVVTDEFDVPSVVRFRIEGLP